MNRDLQGMVLAPKAWVTSQFFLVMVDHDLAGEQMDSNLLAHEQRGNRLGRVCRAQPECSCRMILSGRPALDLGGGTSG